ncbi:MAG: response regulator [Deltaproteobacteria bacterium]|nr:response regulator [Deltaproteobacteria bacterium]
MARVMLVDDEENIRLAFRRFLQEDGHIVHMAGDVAEAGRLLAEYSFDVVVSDIIMPGRKGTELLQQIRGASNGTQVILVTGEPNVETASEAVRAGAFDYIAKPVAGKELRRVVGKAAQMKALYDEKEFLALENLRHQERLEHLVEERTADLSKALVGIVNAMSVTVEKRDPYTAGHQTKVAELARAIATEMGLAAQIVEGTYLASLIHDVGKISVPSDILAKPSELLEEEFALLKRHAEAGYEILSGINFSWPIAEIVRQHHERLDGSGYPRGLTGDAILVQARILAVADTVEAMASHRPYRQARGVDAALAEIQRGAGILYDREVVRASVGLFREKGYVLEAPGASPVREAS